MGSRTSLIGMLINAGIKAEKERLRELKRQERENIKNEKERIKLLKQIEKQRQIDLKEQFKNALEEEKKSYEQRIVYRRNLRIKFLNRVQEVNL